MAFSQPTLTNGGNVELTAGRKATVMAGNSGRPLAEQASAPCTCCKYLVFRIFGTEPNNRINSQISFVTA
jgi:hypothetical protein